MENTSLKNTGWLLTGLVLIALPVGAYLYLESIPVDCDQFSCIGYFVILVPVFLFGVAILLIVLLVNIVMMLRPRVKKNEDEKYN